MSDQTPARHSTLSRLENRLPPPATVAVLGVAMACTRLFLEPALTPAIRLSIGPLLVVLGAAAVVSGARTFWAAGTTIDPVGIARASALVTHGVFRFTRNPMYVGFTLILIGWAVALGPLWALAGPLAFMLFTDRFQVIPEERIMRGKFGPAYDEYCRRTRRWL